MKTKLLIITLISTLCIALPVHSGDVEDKAELLQAKLSALQWEFNRNDMALKLIDSNIEKLNQQKEELKLRQQEIVREADNLTKQIESLGVEGKPAVKPKPKAPALQTDR